MRILTHLLAMMLAIGVVGGLYFYLEDPANLFQHTNETPSLDPDKLELLLEELQAIKDSLAKTNMLRMHLDELFTKIFLQQESMIEEVVAKAIDNYDADKIGLYDYAAAYAGGSVISTPGTYPYPANKTISFFRLVTVNVMSNPEALIQTDNVPGNCFAFHGSFGRIRIKLGTIIQIAAVTLDHNKLAPDKTSAPEVFAVYGLKDPDEDPGTLLGQFTFNITGRTSQTFPIQPCKPGPCARQFGYVELIIMSNYGKPEFSCVYRFRVHNTNFNQTKTVI
ncbi:unnamed protein product [Acanthoscelides obtectus]|uniref:SUN domain-containing protein n=1 Tax=Acanthoscelides obtectus TaxID=200917 RepID=A0A9P0KIM5_ACAOB|nr:unnamed protein product [Acanthoscelides obtectus]CAK1668789.1 SUN domain-containing protein 2 [Acanthoscelides obtectus]